MAVLTYKCRNVFGFAGFAALLAGSWLGEAVGSLYVY